MIPNRFAAKNTKLFEKIKKRVRSKLKKANKKPDNKWEQIDKANWHDFLPDPQERLDKQKDLSKNYKNFEPDPKSSVLRSVRWMNIGDEKIYETIKALKNNTEIPKWAQWISEHLSVQNNKLYLEGMPFLTREQMKERIKRVFFTPSLPVSIQAIYEYLDKKIANITRTTVKRILKKLEIWQRTSRRRKPPTITSRISAKSPGLLCADCFFPSYDNGWVKGRAVLCICDMWSRYVGVYVMDRKNNELVTKCLKDFVQKFIKVSNVFPRRLIIDKGTEFLGGGIERIMEKFRTKRDKNQPMVLRSVTGTPVNFIENVNSDVQNRMQKYMRMSRKPEDLCYQIAYAINHQKRARKGNLTPIQLLSMNLKQRQKVNREYSTPPLMGQANLPPVSVGASVRLLMMTRKEQQSSMKAEHKGFGAKWSGKIYTVVKKTKLRRNPNFYFYYLHGEPAPKYRHEILKIGKEVDKDLPKGMKPRFGKDKTEMFKAKLWTN